MLSCQSSSLAIIRDSSPQLRFAARKINSPVNGRAGMLKVQAFRPADRGKSMDRAQSSPYGKDQDS
jgi:hypothetical protein